MQLMHVHIRDTQITCLRKHEATYGVVHAGDTFSANVQFGIELQTIELVQRMHGKGHRTRRTHG